MLAFMYKNLRAMRICVCILFATRRMMMRKYCKRLGDAGEDFAAKTLEDLGYVIIERKYRTRMGEIDIIAARDGVLHFIEVKTRTGDEYGYPSEAVTEGKQNNIRRVSDSYLAKRRLLWKSVSLDVIEVTFNMIENCM